MFDISIAYIPLYIIFVDPDRVENAGSGSVSMPARHMKKLINCTLVKKNQYAVQNT
jgi:hypothetical protein